jgi:hypothetical protein
LGTASTLKPTPPFVAERKWSTVFDISTIRIKLKRCTHVYKMGTVRHITFSFSSARTAAFPFRFLVLVVFFLFHTRILDSQKRIYRGCKIRVLLSGNEQWNGHCIVSRCGCSTVNHSRTKSLSTPRFWVHGKMSCIFWPLFQHWQKKFLTGPLKIWGGRG